MRLILASLCLCRVRSGVEVSRESDRIFGMYFGGEEDVNLVVVEATGDCDDCGDFGWWWPWVVSGARQMKSRARPWLVR